jgi:hypothetical protein
MNTKTMPQHILNKESIMNEEFKHLIHVDTPTQVVSKPVAAQIMALAKKGVRSKDIGLEMGFVGNAKLAADTFQTVKNKIYFELGKKFEAVNVKVEGTEPESSEETLESLKKMAMGDLERIEDYAEMISDRMKEGQELSAWMYSQITLAVDQLNSVHDTMDGKDGIKESVITEDTRRAKLLGIDFNISEMNGRIFFSFVDKKAASIQLRQTGTNKIVNHIQNRLDIAYGKGTFFFKSGDHAEFQNGYLFQRSTSDINLNKLKFESVNEAKYIQAKDNWGVRLVQAINNNVHGLHTSVIREKRDVKEAVEAFGTMLKNAIKETLKHKYKPHPKAKDADDKIKTFISELKKFENIVDMVIAKPTKIGVTKLDDAWRSVWNYKYAAEIALAGEVFNSIIEGKVNEGKFKVDDLVYNKKTKTVGIVRMGDDKYGEVKTDADGNVNVDELEKYNPIKHKHQQNAKVAPSTEKEVNSRGLFNPFKSESVNEEKPGLWANIRAKRARGEEPAHGNSDAHKDAVKAGKEINNEVSTPGEQIQNLNNRLTKLRQDMAKAKSPEAKNVIQAKMKNALQKLSDKKKDMGIKKP